MSRSARLRLLAPLAVLTLLLGLAGCGDGDDKENADVKPPADLVLEVLTEGTGAVVNASDTVTIEYQGTNWTNGEVFDQSYGRGSSTNAARGFVPGFSAAIVGQKVGSQVVVGIPPEFGYGASGSPGAGIAGTDTMVFVIEIKKAVPAPATKCDVKSGAASNAVKVAGAFGEEATPTFKKPLKVSSLQRTVLTAGTGAQPKTGDYLASLVSIYNGRTGKKIGSSPGTLEVGSAQMPAPFNAAVGCSKIGSRVVTVFPAKDVPGSVDGTNVKASDAIVLVTDVIRIDTTVGALPTPKTWENPPTVEFNGTDAPKLNLPKG